MSGNLSLIRDIDVNIMCEIMSRLFFFFFDEGWHACTAFAVRLSLKISHTVDFLHECKS